MLIITCFVTLQVQNYVKKKNEWLYNYLSTNIKTKHTHNQQIKCNILYRKNKISDISIQQKSKKISIIA